jgi:spore coat polysaccharide biosynthesis protein SpsF
MKTVGVLQARVSSSRLPGKVLKLILGEPMLFRQIERVQRSQRLDHLVVATSKLAEDDAIADLCSSINVKCFRGSLDDVLDRCYQAVQSFNPDQIVRLTGDCPLCDPDLIDNLVEFHIAGDYCYSSNTLNPTYPDGLDVEIFKLSCLEAAFKESTLQSHREHVTPFIYQQPQRFKLGSYRSDIDRSHLRWTVDEQLDFELITKIYESIYYHNRNFMTKDVLDWLENNSAWEVYNTCYQRNEGLTKSFSVDQNMLQDLDD